MNLHKGNFHIREMVQDLMDRLAATKNETTI